MVRLAVRGIRSSLGRLVLTTIAIVAGVGFVAGSFILADSLEDTFDGIFEQASANIDAQVQVADLAFGTDQRTIPDTLIDEVAALPEVGEVTPGVTVDTAQSFTPFIVLDAEGNEVLPPTGAPIISFSWDGEEDENAITLAEGRAPGADEVVIDTAYADLAAVEVGQAIEVKTPDGEATFDLVGLVDIKVTAGAFFVIFDFPTAQTLYDKEGQVDAIALGRAPGTSTEEMIAAVQEILPEEAEVISQQELIEDQSALFEQILSVFRNGLLAFAGIALFVSLFIIYNTFAILVNQRLQQIGMLRAIGASRGQIRIWIVFEALLVGLIGSILGLLAGLGIAFGIKSIFQSAGGFPETNTILAPRTIIVALAVGIVATLVSALLPALLAGRISPIAAMRNEAPARSSRTVRTISGAAVTGLGLVLLGLGLFGSGQSTTAVLTQLAVGAILTFIGVALLSVLFAGPIVNVLGRSSVLGVSLLALGVALPALMFTVGDGVPDGAFGWITFVIKLFVALVAVITGGSILASAAAGRPVGIGGSAAALPGHLARQNAARSPQRTAATATALTIGIALISAVGVVGESIKASFSETLDRAVQADLFIYNQNNSGFSGDLADQVAEVDGIAAVSGFRANEAWIPIDAAVQQAVTDADGPVDVDSFVDDAGDLDGIDAIAAYRAATGEQLLNFGIIDGSIDGLVDGGILVFTDAATDRGLSVGDVVPVVFPDNQVEQMPVAGIFEDNSVLASPWIIDLSVYERHVTVEDDLFVGASIADDADPATVKEAVRTVADGFTSITVEDNEEFLSTTEGQIDGLITLINLLLAFALVVAFLGVINTIVLSVVERTREIGLLRAVGMTQTQVRSTIRWESVIVCLFGAVLGIVLGVLFAWAAVSAIPDDIIGSVAIPFETVLFAILVAALAGVVAALLPARRAARLNVLDAIASTGT
ncbi:MAG: ABC transporter permease [Acidimicrobiales bacterium]